MPPSVSGARWLGLPCGHFTLVDADLFEELSLYSWIHNHQRRQVWANVSGSRVLLHRMIMRSPEGVDVDHQFGNHLDNRRSVLRFANDTQQIHNRRKSPGRSSRFKGVTKRSSQKRPWRAIIGGYGEIKQRVLGSFEQEEDAARAYDRAARELFGEFACVNFPEQGERGALE